MVTVIGNTYTVVSLMRVCERTCTANFQRVCVTCRCHSQGSVGDCESATQTQSFTVPVIDEKEMEGTQTKGAIESASVAALFRRPVIGP